jgi:Cytochrome c7 and related cytochrome c
VVTTRRRFFGRAVLVCGIALAAGIGCGVFESNVPATAAPPLLPGQNADVFTTAHPSMAAAVNDFLGRRPTPVQPIEFPHNVHVGKKIACTAYCHQTVNTGAVAGLPGVRTCMICHNSIARDRPRIQEITEMRKKGIDLAWQRVFGYPAESHVKFNHAPHIRAKVECATCHGNIAEQTVAQRNVELTMGFCVNCHNERKASVDCLACHY